MIYLKYTRLNVQVINIYEDNKIDYMPEQAVKFLERFKKNSFNNKVHFDDENLGYYSSIILSKIISENN